MGLSPVMEIWNVTDAWNLIEEEEEEGAEIGSWEKKNEKKRADKTRICGNKLEFMCSVCTGTKAQTARALQVCCLSDGACVCTRALSCAVYLCV